MKSITLPIFSLRPQEIIKNMSSWGEPLFRSKQVCEWVFKKREFSPDEMSNLPKNIRNKLNSEFSWGLPTVAKTFEAQDEATKLVLEIKKNEFIESVILRYPSRTSLCVSTQIGCKFACAFCQTGRLGFHRNLSADEIVGQFAVASHFLKKEDRLISHIVFMGMGEPLDNFDNVVAAAKQFSDKETFALNPRNVTISTVGLPDKILRLAKIAPNLSLSVSLNAPRDEIRNDLMPINKTHNLKELKESLLKYQKETENKLTFEYILIKNVNASIKDAKNLVTFLHGFRAKVNLILYNPHPDLTLDRPTLEEAREFQKYLSERSIPAPIRHSKGLDIAAACGHLAPKPVFSC